jgi:hypothetical protein
MYELECMQAKFEDTKGIIRIRKAHTAMSTYITPVNIYFYHYLLLVLRLL